MALTVGDSMRSGGWAFNLNYERLQLRTDLLRLVFRLCGVVIVVLFVVRAFAQDPRQSLTVKASSWVNGSFGHSWQVDIAPDGTAIVETAGPLGEAYAARRFKVTPGQQRAIVDAVRQARFSSLKQSVGGADFPLDGSENRLVIANDRRAHGVSLFEPTTTKGDEADRFRRVWNAVVAACPVRPPI